MSLLHAVGGGADDKLYPEDAFVSYVRTGTGADVTVSTGIDMTKGYMVWTKGRSGATDHAIYDSARGVTKDLVTNSTAAETTQTTGLKSVSTTGHTIGSLAKMNTSGATYVDWVFKKAPKFFDVVTYTGDGVAGRQIAHSLGVAPGMIIIKHTNADGRWAVWHISVGGRLALNQTDAYDSSNTIMTGGAVIASSSSTFGGFEITSYTNLLAVNANGATYVAYLFAHDPSADGIIQCGSFTTDASGNATVNLGWEPQYLMTKVTTASASWDIADMMRGYTQTGFNILMANSSTAEVSTVGTVPTSSGFNTTGYGGSLQAIYMAIRRPMKTPTSGTEVFQPIVYTGTNIDNRLVNTIITPDMVMVRERNDTTPLGMAVASRLTGNARLQTANTAAELLDGDSFMTPTSSYGNSFSAMNGFGVGNDATCKVNADTTANNHIALAFKRAKGFFDVVCYTGTGVASTVNHNLGVVPELMIVKSRSAAYSWRVYYGDTAKAISLNSTETPLTSIAWWNNTAPTASVFTIGVQSDLNNTASTFIAYLFATLAGVSKVGSYTGNGTSQTINCGFTTGARFILIKRTDSTGDWYVWDTTRGIVAANDPHLSLNAAAAEVTTDDSIDPANEGFICNQNTATNINVNGGSYIFLAIA